MAADSDFVLDAVVGFLTSPVWSTPVQTFIEEECLVFDPDGENYDAYSELHQHYKDMVETLLSSFAKDVGITAEQFTEACKDRPDNPTFTDVHRNIFEQIWAAEDYEIFKRLMIQKNIEIQLQALKLIEHQGNGPAPPSAPPTPAVIDEDAIMQEVLRRSKEEYDAQVKGTPSEKDIIEKAVEEPKQENERLLAIAKREQEEMERAVRASVKAQQEQREVEVLQKEKHPPVAKASPASTPAQVPASMAADGASPVAKAAPPGAKAASSVAKTAPPAVKAASPAVKAASPAVKVPPSAAKTAPPAVKTAPPAATTPSDAAASWLSSAKAEAASTSTTASSGQGSQMSEEELKRRTEYLKQQRDKLLALKKQERVKHLDKFTEEQPKARPTSARAARRVTAGERAEPTSPTSDDNGKKLAMRRALANVLKREVVDKQ